MVLIQLDVPKKLDKELAILSINSELKDKRKVILAILTKYFDGVNKFINKDLKKVVDVVRK